MCDLCTHFFTSNASVLGRNVKHLTRRTEHNVLLITHDWRHILTSPGPTIQFSAHKCQYNSSIWIICSYCADTFVVRLTFSRQIGELQPKKAADSRITGNFSTTEDTATDIVHYSV